MKIMYQPYVTPSSHQVDVCIFEDLVRIARNQTVSVFHLHHLASPLFQRAGMDLRNDTVHTFPAHSYLIPRSLSAFPESTSCFGDEGSVAEAACFWAVGLFAGTVAAGGVISGAGNR